MKSPAEAMQEVPDYRSRPGARLTLRLQRTVSRKTTGELHREVAYALSSLDLASLNADELLTLWRQHWHIENWLHYVCDVRLGEDACRVRAGSAPRV